MTVTALHPATPAATVPSAAPEAPQPTIVYSPAPAGAAADLPRVFQVIHGVMKDVMPIGKDQKNTQQNYSFRGVDDAMSAMAGPMRAHGCFIAPEVVEIHQRPRGEGKSTHTNLKMLYRIFGPAGDCIAVTLPGEAMDTGDKSTNKAMSAALKYMLFQVFMIPVDARSVDDSDQDARPPAEHRAERQQNQQRRQQQRQQNHQQRNQRQQQNGQQEQQPRRSNRAEPGPWEQQAPQQGNTLSPQARQLLTSAQAAESPEAFAKVRARAEREGATAEFLARLDSIDAEKRRAAQMPQQQAPAGPAPHSMSDAFAAEGAMGAAPADDGYRTGPDAAEQAAAEAESLLRVAASKANLPTLDRDFEMAFGLPIAQARADQLDMFRERIEAAAGGAQ
ncbi:ERF family protein [Streptomyces sp. ISL-112]|uniref:ERF family protein n=1 Tax=unclassified Streptomyces TaxID=2593676 RepID=UPI001BEC0966|nr:MULTISPECIES: ERF family protein [unclassified Streptomyces]MBT2427234.1 ERF family protein [Streptomyces sp. ISL-112]MBT2465778.1 ERF family protein [Streptomyces sp. ISL-63]